MQLQMYHKQPKNKYFTWIETAPIYNIADALDLYYRAFIFFISFLFGNCQGPDIAIHSLTRD